MSLFDPPQALSDAPRPQAKRGAQSQLTVEQRQRMRREQNRIAKQRQRGKGDVKKEIILTPMEELELLACMSMQRGPEAVLLRRALLVGAKFLANAGAPRGKKVHGNGRPSDIMSAIAH